MSDIPYREEKQALLAQIAELAEQNRKLELMVKRKNKIPRPPPAPPPQPGRNMAIYPRRTDSFDQADVGVMEEAYMRSLRFQFANFILFIEVVAFGWLLFSLVLLALFGGGNFAAIIPVICVIGTFAAVMRWMYGKNTS